MNNEQLHNTFMGDDGLPIQIPPPAEAWDNMRKKLDDELPVAGILVPNNIINAGTGFINSITMLFTLLLIGSTAWWLTGTLSIKGINTHLNATTLPQADTANTVNKSNSPLPEGNAVTVLPQNTTGAAGNKPAPGINNKRDSKTKARANDRLSIKKNSRTATTGDVQITAPQQSGNTPAVSDGKKDGIQTPLDDSHAKANTAAIKKDKTDSSTGENKDEVHVEDKSIHIMAGLQWQAQLPFGGTQHYFAGPNASSQPYRLLIPGAWMGLEYDGNLFTIEINPFTSMVYNPKPFVTTTEVNAQREVTTTKKLNKLFGMSAAIRYSYNVKGKWWAGGGVYGDWANKGVATVITETNENGTKTSSTGFARLQASDLSLLSKFKIRTDAELLYRADKWQAGLRAGVYFTPATKSYSTLKNPLSLELFYRWSIWNNGKPRH